MKGPVRVKGILKTGKTYWPGSPSSGSINSCGGLSPRPPPMSGKRKEKPTKKVPARRAYPLLPRARNEAGDQFTQKTASQGLPPPQRLPPAEQALLYRQGRLDRRNGMGITG